jgi:hypothetical protein
VARDTEEGTFEQRAQKWLGAAAEQFEVVFGLEKVLSVEELVESVSQGGQRIKGEEARTLSERLHALGTRQFVYGALFMQRFDQAIRRDPFRIRMSDAASASDFERLLAWRNHCRQPGFVQWLANSRPRLAPNLELTARHKVQEGELVPAEFVFSVEGAFESALRPDGFVVPLLARLNGQQSVGQSFEASRNADELPDGFTLEPFLGLVQRMVDLRLLEVELPISLRGPP